MSTAKIETKTEMTVAKYLQQRLQEWSVKHLFTLAGNYLGGFLDTILDDSKRTIEIAGMPTELVAGYAADAYARIRTGARPTFAAVAVTYGVGAFSVVNAIAGSYVESVPVLLINGAPTSKEQLNLQQAGLQALHMQASPQANLEVFRPITVAAERVTNALQAPSQIDSVLSACLIYSRPVYLEVAEDVWRSPCPPPSLTGVAYKDCVVTRPDTTTALTATLKMLDQFGGIPMLWGGVEIQRMRCRTEFKALVDDTSIPLMFSTNLQAKSLIVTESDYADHGRFIGIWSPPSPDPATGVVTLFPKQGINCLIGIGAWTPGTAPVKATNVVLAAYGGVFVGAQFFASVPLKLFITDLHAALKARSSRNSSSLQPASASSYPPLGPSAALAATAFLATIEGSGQRFSVEPEANVPATSELVPASASSAPSSASSASSSASPASSADSKLSITTYDNFWTAFGLFLKDSKTPYVLLPDVAFSSANSGVVQTKQLNGFIIANAWNSIGYALAAAVGVKFAMPNSRAFVVTGDGAFQETCQAVSSFGWFSQNTVVFVIVNDIYGVVQANVNPKPFRDHKQPVPPQASTDAKNSNSSAARVAPTPVYPKLYNEVFAYNEIHHWKYEQIVKLCGDNKKGEQHAIGRAVTNTEELAKVLAEIADPKHAKNAFVVSVKVAKCDWPKGIQPIILACGEDEIPNPNWPPKSVF